MMVSDEPRCNATKYRYQGTVASFRTLSLYVALPHFTEVPYKIFC